MDHNFAEAIRDLGAGNASSDPKVFEFELAMRRITMELSMKRKQVSQLREEADRGKEINYKLNVNLGEANAKIANMEKQVHIAQQYLNEFRLKFRSQVEAKLQNDMLRQENATLKDALRKSELTRITLQRHQDDLILQKAINEENIKKILEENDNLAANIRKYSKVMNDTLKEKEKILEVHKCMGELKKRIPDSATLTNKIAHLECENKRLEGDLVSSQAKLMTLQNLLKNYSLPKFNERSDLHKYFEEKANDLEQQLKVERELLIKQNERINKDKEANIYLCRKLGEAERKLEDIEHQQAVTDNVENI